MNVRRNLESEKALCIYFPYSTGYSYLPSNIWFSELELCHQKQVLNQELIIIYKLTAVAQNQLTKTCRLEQIKTPSEKADKPTEKTSNHRILLLNFCSVLHPSRPAWGASAKRQSWDTPRTQQQGLMPAAETNVSGSCCFVVGDAKIILAASNGIEKLVSFGQVTQVRQQEAQVQAGASFNDSFTVTGAC